MCELHWAMFVVGILRKQRLFVKKWKKGNTDTIDNLQLGSRLWVRPMNLEKDGAGFSWLSPHCLMHDPLSCCIHCYTLYYYAFLMYTYTHILAAAGVTNCVFLLSPFSSASTYSDQSRYTLIPQSPHSILYVPP